MTTADTRKERVEVTRRMVVGQSLVFFAQGPRGVVGLLVVGMMTRWLRVVKYLWKVRDMVPIM